jgi:hypothetical protein
VLSHIDNNDERICTCTGRHLLWTNDKIQQHTVTVYCKYRLFVIGPTGVCVIVGDVVGWSKTLKCILK